MKKSSVSFEYFETWSAINGIGVDFSGHGRVSECIDELTQKRPFLETCMPSEADNFFSKPLQEILVRHAPKNLRQAMHVLSRLSRELHEPSDVHRSQSRRRMHRDFSSSHDQNASKLILMNALLETVYSAADGHEIRTQRRAVIQRAEAVAKAIAARLPPPADEPPQPHQTSDTAKDGGGGGGVGCGHSTPDCLRADAAPPRTADEGRQVLRAAWNALHWVDPAVPGGGAGLAARGTYLMYLAARVAEVEALCSGLPAAQRKRLLDDPVNGARALSCEIQAARKAAAAAAVAAGGAKVAHMV